MRIIGIDPGLQVCGYAVVDTHSGAETLIEAGAIRTSGSGQLGKRLDQIAHDIDSLIERFSPGIAAVERLYSHYAHPETAILMGHARGVILQRFTHAAVELRDFAATRIKKSLTGNGRATKEQMQRTVQAVLALSAPPEPNDVADAIAVALCCSNEISCNLSAG